METIERLEDRIIDLEAEAQAFAQLAEMDKALIKRLEKKCSGLETKVSKAQTALLFESYSEAMAILSKKL